MPKNRNGNSGHAMMVIEGLVVNVSVRDFEMEPRQERSQLADQLAAAFGLWDGRRTKRVAFVRVLGFDDVERSLILTEEHWRNSSRLLKRDREIKAVGHASPSNFPRLPQLDAHAATLKNPEFLHLFSTDREGRLDDMIETVLYNGRHLRERPQLLAVRTTGYCLTCRESVRRDSLVKGTFANGRSFTRGQCVRCGSDVYRTGSQFTELVARERFAFA